MDPESERVAAERYVSLGTYRKNGALVRTPVWIAAADDTLVVMSSQRTMKSKRLRNDARVELAPCTARGELRGASRPYVAHRLDEPERSSRAMAAIDAKYGWQMSLIRLIYRLFKGGVDHVAYSLTPRSDA